MSIIILIIILCLFIALFALAFILKIIGLILSPFRFLFRSSRKTTSNSQGDQNIHTTQNRKNNKVFEDTEGEYVEFEEIE